MTAPRRRLHAIASLVVLAAILAASVWFVRRHWAEFTALEIVNPNVLWPLVATVPLTAVAIGLQVRYLAMPFGVRLAPAEWYGLAIITSFYNLLTPFRGGMLAKAAYLHRRHEVPLTGFLAMTAGASVVNVCVAGVAGLAGLALAPRQGGPGTATLTLFFAAMTVATLLLMAFSPRIGIVEKPLLARIARVAHGWQSIRDNRAVILKTLAATAAQFALAAAMTFLSFALIGVSVGGGTSLLLASLTMLSVFVGVTPAGLGVSEAVAVVGGIAVGITPAQSLAAAVARRLITTAVILVLGPCFTYTLLREGGAAAGKTT